MIHEQIQSQPNRFPRITVIGTGLLVLAGILLPIGVRTLHDWFRLDPSYPLVLSMAFFMVAFAWWLVWIVTQRRWRWRGKLIALGLLLAIPIGGFILFRPVLGGDLELVGWEWRFTDPSSQFQTAVSSPSGANHLSVSTRWDFPEFLGVQRRGVVSGVELDPDWATHPPELVWKIKVGEGWSGVSAVNRCLITMEQRGDQECVTCYSLDDCELLWIYSHTARHEDSMGMGKVGPRSTPTIFDGHVFAMGATGILVCLDGADGNLVWKRDICDMLGITRKSGVNLRGFRYEEEPTLSWGRAASPLIVGDVVIVPGGGNVDGPKTTLLAFDRRTGDEIWRGGDEMIAYGSPSLATIGGVPQVLLVGESSAMGFSPTTGGLLWRVSRPGSSTGSANCSQVTVVSDYHLLLTKGYNLGGELIAVEWENEAWKPETIWKSHRVLTTKLTSPVVYDGHAYGLSDGFLECVRLDEGVLTWKQRGRFGHGQLLLVDGLLLVHSQDGRMTLVRATPHKYEPLGEINTIQGVCWNTFCLYGPYLIVRSDLEMACFRLPVMSKTSPQ